MGIISKRKTANYMEQIASAKRIAIITHKNADMDAIGSAIALKRLIKRNYQTGSHMVQVDVFTDTANITNNDIKTNIYSVFVNGENFNKQSCKQYDLAICLDSPSRKVLGVYDKIFKKCSDSLNIDHHQTNNIYAKNNIVVPRCSSTCEIIYTLFIKIKHLSYSDAILRYLYAGIITDTNNLTNNLSKNTFKIIDEITGKDTKKMEQLEKIRTYFFKNETRAKFALLSKALEGVRFSKSGRIALMKITKHDFTDTKSCMTDTLGIVDYATRLQGVEIAVMFIKQDDNTYYVSLRSKNSVNVGLIAEKMGGGGHEKIAAFQTKPTDRLKDIKAKLFMLCSEQLKNMHQDDNFEQLFAEY